MYASYPHPKTTMSGSATVMLSLLYQNLEEFPIAGVFIDQVQEIFQSTTNRKMYSALLSKYISVVFPDVKSERRRWNEKRQTLIHGLRWKNTVNDTIIDMNDTKEVISTLMPMMPPGTFIVKVCKDLMIFGHDLEDCLIKVNIDVAGCVEYFLKGVAFFKMKTNLSLECVIAILKSLKTVKLCHGVLSSDKENNNSGKEIFIKSPNCSEVCEILSSNCKMCRRHVLQKKRNSKEKAAELSHDKRVQEDTLTPNSKKLAISIKSLDTPKRNFVENQVQNANRKPSGRRYTAETTELAMSLFAGNPRTLETLRKSNQMVLPSAKHLSKIKNTVKQSPGINEGNLEWMRLIAAEENRPLCDFVGGLLIDEMKVQEDIQLTNTKEGSFLSGLSIVKGDVTMASHVLQFLYVGLGDFRFPVAHYPTTNLSHIELYDYFWDVCRALYRKGFRVKYCMMDGASTNRSFINLQISSPKEPITTNIIDNSKLVFIQDPSHVVKKIRNSILNSGQGPKKTREMELDGYSVLWNQWVEAYLWDQRKHSFPIHRKLSDTHLYPSESDKMRNHLAFDCLDADMLHLMKLYQKSLGDNGSSLNGAITLLTNTSALVTLFSDTRPITDIKDERVDQLTAVGKWFQEWEDQTKTNQLLLAPQTREDITIMVNGIIAMIRMFIENEVPFVPAKANSDLIENFFCQQRGIYHGCNSHPTYGQYCTAINSIILSQHTLSTKSNAGKSSQGKTCYSAAAKSALKNVQI